MTRAGVRKRRQGDPPEGGWKSKAGADPDEEAVGSEESSDPPSWRPFDPGLWSWLGDKLALTWHKAEPEEDA